MRKRHKYYYAVVGQNGLTSDDVDAFLAVAMFAMGQGLQVSIAFDDATSQCYISAIKVSS